MDRSVSMSTDPRERVAACLTFMACGGAQEVLGRWINREQLAFELCRIWFDEVYVLGRRYLDAWKGDYSEEAASHFRSAFSADEIKALERFNRFLELRVEMLSRDARSNGRFPDNDAWKGIARDAFYVLDDLEPDAAYRRARLAEAVAELGDADAVADDAAHEVVRLIAAGLRSSED